MVPAAAAASSFSHGHTFAYTRRTSTEYDEEQMQHVLQEVFHLSRLRNLQPQAIRGAMEHQSQMIVMATGYVHSVQETYDYYYMYCLLSIHFEWTRSVVLCYVCFSVGVG